jgi:hypothetical protein
MELDPRKLRDDWPLSPIRPPSYDSMPAYELLWATKDGTAADMLVQQLVDRGVTALLRATEVSESRGAAVFRYPEMGVFVPEPELETARLILLRFRYESELLDQPIAEKSD